MATTRTAQTHWEGTLFEGAGKVTLESSGSARTTSPGPRAPRSANGKTSPEELIAAAHSACFSMALSNGLAKAGTPPHRAGHQGRGRLRPRHRHHRHPPDRRRHASTGIERRGLRRRGRGRQGELPGQPGAHRHHDHARRPRWPERARDRRRRSLEPGRRSVASAAGVGSAPGRPSRCQTTRCGSGISMPSWSKRALIRCAHLAGDRPLLQRRGLEQHPHGDRRRGSAPRRPSTSGSSMIDALEVLVLPQVVGDLAGAPAGPAPGPRRRRRRRRATVRAQFWLMLPTRRISPLRTYQTVPLTSRSRVTRRLTASTVPLASPTSTTSPTPYWSSKIMKMPDRKSLTRLCAPKPSATPRMPALAMIGAMLYAELAEASSCRRSRRRRR